jgi:hypothetical protein
MSIIFGIAQLIWFVWTVVAFFGATSNGDAQHIQSFFGTLLLWMIINVVAWLYRAWARDRASSAWRRNHGKIRSY